jgi:uncharacterized membrane protein YeaQ/YmgE (transglycosylase-associated protein family)
MTNIIGWIVIGLITGWVSLALYPGNQDVGFINNVLVGIAGSFVGGFIGNLVSKESITKPTRAGFILSVVGGLLVTFVARRFGLLM